MLSSGQITMTKFHWPTFTMGPHLLNFTIDHTFLTKYVGGDSRTDRLSLHRDGRFPWGTR